MALRRDDVSARLAEAKNTFGKYYTPECVCRLVATLASHDLNVSRVLDPTCGSGAMLYYAHEVIGDALYCGQELSPESVELARQNLAHMNASIVCGDTLTAPYDWGAPFDCVVGNPPYSVKWDPQKDDRFSVLAPKSKADLAFVQHSLHWLRDGGRAVIVLFPGALYRVGAEEKIRREWLANGWIRAVIQLPSNLFEATAISTCAVVFEKTDAPVLFVDASALYEKVGKMRVISDAQIAQIVDAVVSRKEVPEFTALAKPESDLSPSKYITKKIVNNNPYYGMTWQEIAEENRARRKRIEALEDKLDELLQRL